MYLRSGQYIWLEPNAHMPVHEWYTLLKLYICVVCKNSQTIEQNNCIMSEKQSDLFENTAFCFKIFQVEHILHPTKLLKLILLQFSLGFKQKTLGHLYKFCENSYPWFWILENRQPHLTNQALQACTDWSEIHLIIDIRTTKYFQRICWNYQFFKECFPNVKICVKVWQSFMRECELGFLQRHSLVYLSIYI